MSHRAILLVWGAVALTVLLGGTAALAAFRGGHGQHALPPLPPGPPRSLAVDALTEGVDLPAQLKESKIVFVGTVQDVGGSEPIGGVTGAPLTRHRIRFDIVRQLRGDLESPVDVSVIDIPEDIGIAQAGETYLVFASYRRLGDMTTNSLVPDGYVQGIYHVTQDGRATNRYNGTHDADEVEHMAQDAS